MRVAVIGAGFSGITTTKYLTEFGHNVTAFEQKSTVGGVWCSDRSYPGVATQNTKDTYYLSDMPMPSHYPTWPSGPQVQSYLEAYVAKHNLAPLIQLNTTVVHAEPMPNDEGWTLTIRPSNDESDIASKTLSFDHLVVCNGTFNEPNVLTFPGQTEFEKAGGSILHSSHMSDGHNTVRDKHTVVIGYGKSSCDVANALEETSASTTLVARRLIWKMPRKLYGLPYQYLLLTRFGESLFQYIRPGPIEYFLNSGYGIGIRNTMLGTLQSLVTRQLGLRSIGLVPPGKFEDIARATISLTTEGFYQKVADNKIKVVRDCKVERLAADEEGHPVAHLSNGDTVRCDTLVCATGFKQRAKFLPESIQKSMMDERGNWLLYRHILPIGIPNLTFNGYNSSLFCPTSSEAAAIWIVAYLDNQIQLPDLETQRHSAKTKLEWLESRSKGKHAHGTNLVPFSLHSIDDTLEDVGVNITSWARFRQWLLPVRPSDYTNLARALHQKRKATNGTASTKAESATA